MNKFIIIVKVAWISLCLIFFWQFFDHPDKFNNSEVLLLFFLKMNIITFPSGLFIWFLFSVMTHYVPGPIIGKEIDIAIRWSSIVVFGYFQWFIIVPIIIRKIKKEKARKGQRGN